MLVNRNFCSYFVRMDIPKISITALYILAALGYGPSHIFRLVSVIQGLSLMGFRPSPQRLRSALARLVRYGWVVEVWSEHPLASHNPRLVYEITEAGVRRLRAEQLAYARLSWVGEQSLSRRSQRNHRLAEAERIAAAVNDRPAAKVV